MFSETKVSKKVRKDGMIAAKVPLKIEKFIKKTAKKNKVSASYIVCGILEQYVDFMNKKVN